MRLYKGMGAALLLGLAGCGDVLWVRQGAGAENVRPRRVAMDRLDRSTVTGHYYEDADFGGGALPRALDGPDDHNFFIVQYAADGSLRWSRGLAQTRSVLDGAPDLPAIIDVGTGPTGAVTIASHLLGPTEVGGTLVDGNFMAQLTPDGAFRWVRSLPANLRLRGVPLVWGLAVEDTGNIVLAASAFREAPAGLLDGHLARYSADGALLMEHRMPVDAGETLAFFDVAVDVAENIYLVGVMDGSHDFGGGPVSGPFVVKLDPEGNHLWTDRLRASGMEIVPAGIAVLQNRVVVSALFFRDLGAEFSFAGVNLSSADSALLAYDVGGGRSWARAMGLDISDVGINANHLVVAGTYVPGRHELGAPPADPTPGVEVKGYVAKYRALDGTALWVREIDGGTRFEAAALSANGVSVTAGTFRRAVDFGPETLVPLGRFDAFILSLGP